MSELKKSDSGRRVKPSKNGGPGKNVIYGQLSEDRPDFRKSPLSVLYYNMRFIFPDSYPAKFNSDLVKDFILLYADPGETVLDPFVGSGESIVQAGLLGRRGVGYDINPKAIDIAKSKVEAHSHLLDTNLITLEVQDSRNIPLPDNSVKLTLTSPPFGTSIDAKHINYSPNPDDLGNSTDYGVFLKDFRIIIKEIVRVLEPNGMAVIEMRDRGKGLFIPLGALTMIELIKAGLEPWGQPVVPWPPYSFWPYGPKEARKFLPCHGYLCIARKTGRKGLSKYFGLED